MNLTDLCDDMLFRIFSYLNLDDGYRLPLVCKRFWCFIQQNNFPISTASSMELETLKLTAKKHFNHNRIFERLGSHLKNFTINSNEDAFEVKLIMKSIGKCCHNINAMAIRLLYADTVKSLPKSLHSLAVGDYRASCLNISHLTHLKELSLVSSHALDEIKVYRPLQELHLELRLGNRMPDYANINRLITMVSEKFDVSLHSDYSRAGYFYGHRIHTIALNELNRIMNLKLFTMDCFFVRIDGINSTNISSTRMLCNCGHYVLLSLNTSYRILNNYHGPDPTPATKVVRYTPGISLTIKFEFDDYDDRYKYFERLRLGFPICSCESVVVSILFE